MGRLYLTDQQKAAIHAVVQEKRDCILYKSMRYDASKKAYGTETHAALVGDATHFLAHGITMGSIFYQAGRSMRWSELAENVYNNAIQNNLKAYHWVQKLGTIQQVTIIGNKYITVYQDGEYQKKQIFFNNIVMVSFSKKVGLEIVDIKPDGKYHKTKIYNVYQEMEDLVGTVLLYTMRAAQNGVKHE